MEDITDTDYTYFKTVCKDFEMKKLGECHDLHVQCNALLLADVIKNFRNMFLKINELNPACPFIAPGLV